MKNLRVKADRIALLHSLEADGGGSIITTSVRVPRTCGPRIQRLRLDIFRAIRRLNETYEVRLSRCRAMPPTRYSDLPLQEVPIEVHTRNQVRTKIG